jgi:divalent metal cation (Fe/Co/Zn/Cd) transporter
MVRILPSNTRDASSAWPSLAVCVPDTEGLEINHTSAVGYCYFVGASLVNQFVARILLRAGRQYNSITLEVDTRHLMTDV